MFLWGGLVLIGSEVIWWSELWGELSMWRILGSRDSGAGLKSLGWLHVARTTLIAVIVTVIVLTTTPVIVELISGAV